MIDKLQYVNLIEATQLYFQGEKFEALVFILPLGLLSIVFSIWLVTDNPSSFSKGVAIPFLFLGLLMGTVGSVVGYRTPLQVTTVIQSIEIDPLSAVEPEIQRMIKVNKAWPLYLAIWLVFGISGLLLRFAGAPDFYQGLGIALVFFAGVGLLIDGLFFSQARSRVSKTILIY